MSIRAKHYIVKEYWVEYYSDTRGGCTLCGNRGMIDTTGVLDWNKQPIGKRNYCICPNGQEMRKRFTT